MISNKKLLCVLLIFALALIPLSGCKKTAEEEDEPEFNFSEGIALNGHWEGVRALDYVEIFNYRGLAIPSDVHIVSDEKLQAGIDKILAYFETAEIILNRAVADGDTLNVDYVGTIDGEEFVGSKWEDAFVTIGTTGYMGNFLEQLIGHMPGDTFNAEVTFPDEYPNDPSLQGKNAVFVTTVNYIIEQTLPELTDEFVLENLLEYGFSTVAQIREALSADLQKKAIQEYVKEYLATEVSVRSIPDTLVEYPEKAMKNFFQENAKKYGLELEEYIKDYVDDASSFEDLIEINRAENTRSSTYYLVIQAVAEDAHIAVNSNDIRHYFTDFADESEYGAYEEQFGLPFIRQVVLSQKVLDYIIENVVLE